MVCCPYIVWLKLYVGGGFGLIMIKSGCGLVYIAKSMVYGYRMPTFLTYKGYWEITGYPCTMACLELCLWSLGRGGGLRHEATTNYMKL